MLTPDGKLEIFDEFRFDESLPKCRERRERERALLQAEDDELLSEEQEGPGHPFRVRIGGHSIMTNRGVRIEEPRSWFERFLDWFRGKPETRPTMSVPEFFKSVRNSAEELVIVEERAAGYEKALQQTKRNGQTALYEQLLDLKDAIRDETQLLAMGLPKFVEERTIVEFVRQTKRGLRLDWLANYTRLVPDAVMERKHRADELRIFDNYVVLHYDPEGKAVAQTKLEKDPILFGVIRGRRRLYFVGDWVDELCDLTLDQIADKLGKDAISEIHPDPGVGIIGVAGAS